MTHLGSPAWPDPAGQHDGDGQPGRPGRHASAPPGYPAGDGPSPEPERPDQRRRGGRRRGGAGDAGGPGTGWRDDHRYGDGGGFWDQPVSWDGSHARRGTGTRADDPWTDDRTGPEPLWGPAGGTPWEDGGPTHPGTGPDHGRLTGGEPEYGHLTGGEPEYGHPADHPAAGPGRAPEPAGPSAGPPGRAGRNLPAAIAVGLGLGAVILAPLFLWRPAFLGVVVVAVGVGIWEMVRAVGARAHPPLVPLLAGGVIMAGLAWYAGPEALVVGLVLTVGATTVWRLSGPPRGFQADLAAATLVAMYVPFLAGFAVLLVRPSDGHLRILVTLAAVVLSDTGGYAAGVLFGRHPMSPTVSPKKSWEGLAGSILATALGGALLFLFVLHTTWWHGAVFGVAVSIASVVGDLAESLLKRDLGVKDMSRLLPGHGGLMDRLDSVLFAVPTAYMVFALLGPGTGG